MFIRTTRLLETLEYIIHFKSKLYTRKDLAIRIHTLTTFFPIITWNFEATYSPRTVLARAQIFVEFFQFTKYLKGVILNFPALLFMWLFSFFLFFFFSSNKNSKSWCMLRFHGFSLKSCAPTKKYWHPYPYFCRHNLCSRV